MWLVCDFGFFSIVAKPGDAQAGMLTVRARVRGDLETLKRRYLPTMGPIRESKVNDYRFRARAPKAAVASAMALAVEGINYDNVKARVRETQGPAREAVLHDVWLALYALQRP
jgi:hypothetical protein